MILASDVFHSGSEVESLLFGSLLLLDAARPRASRPRPAASCSSASLLTWAAALAGDAASTPTPRARSACARAVPDAALLGARGAARDRGAVGASARCWRRRCSSCRPRRRGCGLSRLRSWQVADRRCSSRSRASAGLWLSVQTNAPPGRDDRGARRSGARVRGRRRCARAVRRRTPRGVSPLLRSRPRRVLARSGAPAGMTAAPTAASVVATTTQLGDIVRARRRATRVDVHQILQPNTDPHDYEPRPGDVQAPRRARSSSSPAATTSTTGSARSSRRPAAPPTVIGRRRQRCAASSPASPTARDGHASPTRTGGTTRATSSRAIGAIGDALARAAPGSGAQRLQARAAALPARRCARSTRASRRASPRVPRAQRKLVTDHDAFGYFAARYGITVVGAVDPVADDAGAAVGGRARGARAHDRARARAGRLPGELAQPGAGPDARARRPARRRDYDALRRHARRRRARAAPRT